MSDVPSKKSAKLCIKTLTSFAGFPSLSTKVGNFSSSIGMTFSVANRFHLRTAALQHFSVVVNLLAVPLRTTISASKKSLIDATAMKEMTERAAGMFNILILKSATLKKIFASCAIRMIKMMSWNWYFNQSMAIVSIM